MAAAKARAPAADKRGDFPWDDRPMPPAPNAWSSSSLLSLKNDGGSSSFGNINDRPSSRGSSRTSTDGSDLLDSPLAWGQTSHNSTTAISHPQRTDIRSGSWRFPHSQTSFSDVLKGPLNSIAKRRPTSHRKGFTLSADDFPVLVSESSQSNSQLGNNFQGRPSFSSVIIATRDEQRKVPTNGGDPFSTSDFSMEAQQAQLHATQTPDICMPPPCTDYWHPPPDHPPDRNGIWHGGAASYGLGKPADTHSSFPVESFIHNGQSLLNQGGETRHGLEHGGYQPENNDSCYAHVPADASVKILPCLTLGNVKDNHSDALEKQLIKKDVALLEKIKCLNIKARNLRASNISEISSCMESKVGRPKSIDVEAYHVANYAPVSAVTCDITSAFDIANSVSESSNHVPIGTSNVSASANLVMVDQLSEGHPTIFSEAREPGESADNHVYGVGNTSRNKHVNSVTNTASDIWGPGWEEHSRVDSLPVDMTNTHEDQRFAGNSSQQVDVRTADDMLNSPDYEIQNSMRETSSQHEKQIQEDERGEIGQKAKTIVKLEALHRHPFVQSQNSNGTPGRPADYHRYRGWNSSRKWHGSSAEDISSSISGHGWEDHQDLSFSGNTSSWQVHMRTDDMINSSDYEIQKGASESYDSTAQMHLQVDDKRRQVHSQRRILRGPPASESTGLNKGSSIHNVMPSAKNNGINMKEYIARKSALQSHENSAPKHLQMEIRRRQVRSQEGVLRGRSNIAESTENITTDTGALVDTWNAEAKPQAEFSTHSKNRRPASPLVFGTKNTEASSVHKAHISGVVINSAIIPVPVSSVRGFTVGSIMLGDASLAFVNQEKTVAKEVHDDITPSCSIPKQTAQSGMNQPSLQRVKDPHGSDSIMHTQVKEPRKKEQSEAGGLNCAAIPTPIQPSVNQSIVSQNSAPAKTSEMERDAHKPAYKELDLQNPRQMLPAENPTTSFDNLSTSKSDTKTVDEEALDALTAIKAEAKTEPENWEDEKTSKHLGRSSASSNQESMNSSASGAPGLNEQEANSVLKIMHELSDKIKQVEKQLDSSTHVATVNHLQPTQMVSMPGCTWGEHQAGRSQRQYHVDGQGSMWINYATNSHMDGRVLTQEVGLQTAHLLPGPFSGPVPVPENNSAGINIGPAAGWMWDTAERVLISDMGDAPGLGTARAARSGAAPTQNAYRVGQMDVMLGVQAMGGMAYGAAADVNPEVLYHTGPELEQLNPAWFPHVQHDSMHHHGGTVVYLLGMDGGAGAQAHGGTSYATGPPMVGTVHPEYQLVPAAASAVAGPRWTDGGSAMVGVGHPAETWGAAYGDHVYFV